jgi:hypothetical protein
MNVKPIRTNPSAQVIYVLGWWAWCYRIPALIVYAITPLLLAAAYFTALDLVRDLSIKDIAAGFILVQVFILIPMYWRYLQSRAIRIVFSPDSALLIVRTLNFTTRRIPLTALENACYEEESNSDTDARIPVLKVDVRGGLPIKIDLDGRILDERAFKALFNYSPHIQRPASSIYSLQEYESRIAHTEGVRDGSQGLRSNPWETHESAEHPEGMRE